MSEPAQESGDKSSPAKTFDPMGYDLAEEFLNRNVRVYMSSGSVLSGNLTMLRGKYILVRNTYSKEALINLDHVASMTHM
jgi:hypothetical protein